MQRSMQLTRQAATAARSNFTASPAILSQQLRSYRSDGGGSNDFVQRAASQQQSSLLVLRLYKKIVRSIPMLLRQFEMTDAGKHVEVARNLRTKFNASADITNTAVVDTMRHKAELDWEECVLMHKTKSHFNYTVSGQSNLADGLSKKKKSGDEVESFMDEFLTGATK